MNETVYADFVNWLNRVSQSSPPPNNVVAYNFGIFESESGYILYLIGSREYDPDDDDWACSEDYVPVEKYFMLPKNLADGRDWQGVQREVVRIINRFIESPECKESFLAHASAITAGFDDGDLYRVV